MKAKGGAKLRCQRVGCDAMYDERNNPEGGCVHHPGAPLFHDGVKEWTCCRKRSHDFSTFMNIPGCTRGKHTQEKPQTMQRTAPVPAVGPAARPRKLGQACTVEEATSREQCPRCRQGFFCSDHTQMVDPTEQKPKHKVTVRQETDPSAFQTCRHPGCGTKFQEKHNHPRACHYHPGPPVFHDRKRGWKCCEIYVNTFDEFLNIPPCTWGRHDANV